MVKQMVRNWIIVTLLLFTLSAVVNVATASIYTSNTAEVFLQGNYLELGVHLAGSLGSAGKAPMGFHNSSFPGDRRLGLVCDFQKDGWNVGTPPQTSDIVVSFVPVEGWSVKCDTASGSRNFANYGLMGNMDVPMADLYFTNNGTMRSVIWKGTANSGSAKLDIKQTISIDQNDIYVLFNVSFTNSGTTTLSNLRYVRIVDPDQEASFTGDSRTSNYALNATWNGQPVPNACFVMSKGLQYGVPFGLGTVDSRAAASVVDVSKRDPDNVLNGGSPPDAGTPLVADMALGLAFRLGTLAPGQTTTINFAMIFNPQDAGRVLSSLALTSPGAGVQWGAGTSQLISWSSTGSLSGNVSIDIYQHQPDGTDQFVNNIAPSVPLTDNQYLWAIPTTLFPGQQYRVKISSVENPSVFTFSDGVLTITPPPTQPTITLTSPASGTQWGAGTGQSIAWTTTGDLSGYVNLDIYQHQSDGTDQFVNNIASSVPLTDGQYLWAIPAILSPGQQYRVKISSVANPTVYAFSAGVFTITVPVQPSFTLTSPASGTQWDAGTSQQIAWTWTGGLSGIASIDLFQHQSDGTDQFVNNIASAVLLTNGQYLWAIPPTLSPGQQYRVKISSVANPTISAFSSGFFSILAPPAQPTLTLTSPGAGVQWSAGTSQQISWTWTGSLSGNVNVDIYQHQPDGTDQFVNNIAAAVSLTDSQYLWAIPVTLSPGQQYRVKISSAANPTISAFSSGVFSILAQSTLTLTSPGAGVRWGAGTTEGIVWGWTGSLSGNVSIDLYQHQPDGTDKFVNNIAFAVPLTDGQYLWVIPAILSPGQQYRVKINSVANSTVYAFSVGVFSIVAPTAQPSLILASPIGGEHWYRSSSFPISWASTGNIPTVKLILEKSGVAVLTITDNLSNSGNYLWTIPANLPSGPDYQLVITSDSDATVTNTSPAVFSIQLAAPTLISPMNTAQNVAQSVTLTWNLTPGAATYTVQLAQDNAFTTGVINLPGLAVPTATLTLSPNTQYYWWVRSADSAGFSDWSAAWSFITINPPQNQPDLLVKNAGDAAYLGNNLFNTNGLGQTVQQTIPRTVEAMFDLQIINKGTSADRFVITGPLSTPGTAIRYTDDSGLALPMAAGGWTTPQLQTGASLNFHTGVLVSDAVTTQTSGTIQAVSLSNPARIDVVDWVLHVGSAPVMAPAFTPHPPVSFITSGTITLTCPTSNAVISYSINSGTSWITYLAPFTLTRTTTVLARAAKNSQTSAMVKGLFTVQTANATADNQPGTYVNPVTVTLSCATPNASLWYRLNSGVWQLYTAPLSVITSLQLDFKATLNGLTDSQLTGGMYNLQAAMPEISPASGSFIRFTTVRITTTTQNAAIYYQINSGPWILYKGALLLTQTAVIRAKTIKSGMMDSPITPLASFTLTSGQAATPEFVPTPGPYQGQLIIAVTCATPDAVIRYTTDNSDPTTSSPVYNHPIYLLDTTTLKAKAYKSLFTDSAIKVGTFILTGDIYEPDNIPSQAKVIENGKPQIRSIHKIGDIDWVKFILTQRSDVNVDIGGPGGVTAVWLYGPNSSAALIAYNDNSHGSLSHISRIGTTALDPGTYYIKIKEYANDGTIPYYLLSLTTTAWPQVASPAFVPSPGTFFGPMMVAMACATPGAVITYTTDGSDPTINSAVYNSPVLIISTTTLKAAAFKSGTTANIITRGVYTIMDKVATPTFSPNPSIYTLPVQVLIGCMTSGAEIHYTTDGSVPTQSSPLFRLPIQLTATTTINARAFLTGHTDSDIASATYTLTSTVSSANISAAVNTAPTASLSGVNLTITPASPQLIGSAITLAATPVGAQQVEYEFTAAKRDNYGTWVNITLQSFSPLASCVWMPGEPGAYRVAVYARVTGTTRIVMQTTTFVVNASQ